MRTINNTQNTCHKKLTLVSVIIRQVKYSAFIYLEDGKTVTYEVLRDMFPAFNLLQRGETWSHG